MKRSEVLKDIESFLSQYYYQGPTDTHDDASIQLLEILEKSGIVRPIKKLSNSETLVINQFGQVIAKTEDSEVIEIGWEEE